MTATDTQVAFDSIFPRRVLLNTSASVMKYWRDGEGFDGSGHIKYFDAIDKIEPPARIPSPGDLFLNVNLRQSHEAILRVFVPTDRIISSWVPCWRFGFAVKESTRGINYDVPIEVGVYKSIGQHYEIHDQFELVSMLIDIPSDVQITPGDISSATTSHNYNGITNDVVFHDIVKFSVFTTEIMTTNLKTTWWSDLQWRDKYTKVIGARCGDVGSLYYADIIVETRLTFEACEEKMDEWMNGEDGVGNSVVYRGGTNGLMETHGNNTEGSTYSNREIHVAPPGAVVKKIFRCYLQLKYAENMQSCNNWIYEEGTVTWFRNREGDVVDTHSDNWGNSDATLVSKNQVSRLVVFRPRRFTDFFDDLTSSEKWHYVTPRYTGSEFDCEMSCKYEKNCDVYAYTNAIQSSIGKCFILLHMDGSTWRNDIREKSNAVVGKLSDMITNPGIYNCKQIETMPLVFVLGVTDRFKAKNDDVVMIGTEFTLADDQVVVNMNANTDRCLAYYANEKKIYCVEYTKQTSGIQSYMTNIEVYVESSNSDIISFAVSNNNYEVDMITLLCYGIVTLEPEEGENENVILVESYTLKRLNFDGDAVADPNIETLRTQETNLMRIAASETGIVGLRLEKNSVKLIDYSYSMQEERAETTLMFSENTATVLHIEPAVSRLFSAVSAHHASGRVLVLCHVKSDDDYSIRVYVVDSLITSLTETGRKLIGQETIDEGIVRRRLSHTKVYPPSFYLPLPTLLASTTATRMRSRECSDVDTDNASYHQVICVSTSWTDAGSVVVGFSGVVYRVNVSPSGITVVKVEKGFLQNTHFARSHAAYIQIPYVPLHASDVDTVSMQSNSVRTCAILSGFVKVKVGQSRNGYIALRGRYDLVGYTRSPYVYEAPGKQGASKSQYTTTSEAYTAQSSIVSSDFNLIHRDTGNIYTHVCVRLDINNGCHMTINTPGDSYVRIQMSGQPSYFKRIIAHDRGCISIFKGVPASIAYIYGKLDDTSHVNINEDRSNPLTSYVGQIDLCNGAEIVTLKTYTNGVPDMINKNGLRHIGDAAALGLPLTRLDNAWRYVHMYLSFYDIINNASAMPVAISVQIIRRTEADSADGDVTIELDKQRTVAIDALTLLPVLSMGVLITECERQHGLGPLCGDGARSDGEDCDDGGDTSNDGCSSECIVEEGWLCSDALCGLSRCSSVCGDGVVVSGEVCDDENTEDGDGCSAICTLECGYTLDASRKPIAGCGNGVQSPGEHCDDSNTVSGDGCDANCNIENRYYCDAVECQKSMCNGKCGDGVLQSDQNETCDDSNAVGGDGCSADCTVECGFECNETNTTTYCYAMCGDGVRTDSEACDDGNTVNGDGCDSICNREDDWQCRTDACAQSVCGQCGDGLPSLNEACDDNNTQSGDGCSDTCMIECGYRCTLGFCSVRCGDGVVHADEGCDDGNLHDGDGCSKDCTVETAWACLSELAPSCSSSVCTTCGDGIVTEDEECDDGGALDGCSSTCTVECGFNCPGKTRCYFDCGDGIIHSESEQCDDGNVDDGDGCDSLCREETGHGWRKIQTPCGMTTYHGYCGDGSIDDNSGETCDDGNIINGDGCSDACIIECGYYCETGVTVASHCTHRCGDGILHEDTEECDHGEDSVCCDIACRIQSGCEHKSSGNTNQPNCPSGVSGAICGDGFLVDNETCEDGDSASNDGCSDKCTVEDGYVCTGILGEMKCANECGNGVKGGNKVCDDGNTDNDDGCSYTCTLECGFYENPDAGHTPTQYYHICGDGIRAVSEECDDGNISNGDGCDSGCKLECGDGIRCTDGVKPIPCAGRECDISTCFNGNSIQVQDAFTNDNVKAILNAETLSTTALRLDALQANYDTLNKILIPATNEYGRYTPGLINYLIAIDSVVKNLLGDTLSAIAAEEERNQPGSPFAIRRLMSVDTRNASVRDMPPPKVPSATNAGGAHARARRLLQTDTASVVAAPRFQYQSLVYVPTTEELAELHLETVLHGHNEQDWERLHVTVALEWALPQSCAWAVSVQHVDETTVTYSKKSALHRLGCAIVADNDTYAVCHLEVCSYALTPSRARCCAAACCALRCAACVLLRV